MDLEDYAAIGNYQRHKNQRANEQALETLKGIERAEENKSWVASTILFVENEINSFYEDPLIEKICFVHYAKLCAAQNSFHTGFTDLGSFIYDSDTIKELHEAAGSSLDLRREIEKTKRKGTEVIKDFESEFSELIEVYNECNLLIREQFKKMKLMEKLISIRRDLKKNPKVKITPIPAGDEFVEIIEGIKLKFNDVGYPADELLKECSKSETKNYLLLFTSLYSFPFYYDAEWQTLNFDKDFASSYKLKIKKSTIIGFLNKKQEQLVYGPMNYLFGLEYDAGDKVKAALEKEKEATQGACFIATAVYGDYNHPKVLRFRRFRDNYLMTNFFGRYMTKLYYKFGPYFADAIKPHPRIKSVVRGFLDRL